MTRTSFTPSFSNTHSNIALLSLNNNSPVYTPTGVGLLIVGCDGLIIKTLYNVNQLGSTPSVDGNSYETLSKLFPYKNATYVLFTLYDGSIGRSTLVDIIHSCLLLQHRYVLTDETSFCNRMTLEDVAVLSGFDITTVSRCTREVRVYGPHQTYTLDSTHNTLTRPSLFDEGVQRYNYTVGRIDVLRQIKAMIDNEDSRKPLSDLTICNELKDLGYNIKRRTVAKYRGDLLEIPSSHDRKQR